MPAAAAADDHSASPRLPCPAASSRSLTLPCPSLLLLTMFGGSNAWGQQNQQQQGQQQQPTGGLFGAAGAAPAAGGFGSTGGTSLTLSPLALCPSSTPLITSWAQASASRRFKEKIGVTFDEAVVLESKSCGRVSFRLRGRRLDPSSRSDA